MHPAIADRSGHCWLWRRPFAAFRRCIAPAAIALTVGRPVRAFRPMGTAWKCGFAFPEEPALD
jgi:hypothetical protein